MAVFGCIGWLALISGLTWLLYQVIGDSAFGVALLLLWAGTAAFGAWADR